MTRASQRPLESLVDDYNNNNNNNNNNDTNESSLGDSSTDKNKYT
jgi:hypothetical protein